MTDSELYKSLGTHLREAREARGMSTSELGERTRIKLQQIEGLEADDFSLIPAPMYGKGFVKLLSQFLELDSEKMLQLYAEQSGEKPAEPRRKHEPILSATQDLSEVANNPPPRSTKASEGGVEAMSRGKSIPLPRLPAWFPVSLQNPLVLGGMALILVLLLGFPLLRSLLGQAAAPGDEESGTAPQAQVAAGELPELEQPLLMEPGPVWLEIPRAVP